MTVKTQLNVTGADAGSILQQTSMIITIDGPAGAGKSTIARLLAERLGFGFLDTGAMYRAVGWECYSRRINLEDSEAVAAVACNATLQFDADHISCNGRDVTVEIRSAEASHAASVVSTVPKVRDEITRLQREAAYGRDYVTEGRDQGTVVFPDADCKVFLTADTRERAERRLKELEARGVTCSLEKVLAQIEERDERDRNRQVAPLVKAVDALEIDTSGCSISDVIDRIEAAARERFSLSR